MPVPRLVSPRRPSVVVNAVLGSALADLRTGDPVTVAGPESAGTVTATKLTAERK